MSKRESLVKLGVPLIGEIVLEELQAREWSRDEFERRMQGDDPQPWVEMVCDMILERVEEVLLGPEVAKRLAWTFGTSEVLWLNLAGEGETE